MQTYAFISLNLLQVFEVNIVNNRFYCYEDLTNNLFVQTFYLQLEAIKLLRQTSITMNYQFLRTTDTVYCIYFGMSMAYRKIGAAPLKITN